MAFFQNFRQRLRSWSPPTLLVNKYVATLFIFGVWMTFFDSNNFLRQYHRITDLNSVRQKTTYYETETVKAAKQLHALQHDVRALERFARETYYMKKPNEDVFVIVEE